MLGAWYIITAHAHLNEVRYRAKSQASSNGSSNRSNSNSGRLFLNASSVTLSVSTAAPKGLTEFQ